MVCKDTRKYYGYVFSGTGQPVVKSFYLGEYSKQPSITSINAKEIMVLYDREEIDMTTFSMKKMGMYGQLYSLDECTNGQATVVFNTFCGGSTDMDWLSLVTFGYLTLPSCNV